ncbi:MAG: hypothetical protein P1S60_02575 [Anaerolineae bacterium]|nr:hypothetical protein [Anaerolineae bacterium]
MHSRLLYSASPILKDIVCNTANHIILASEQPLHLVEYITLPDFGQRIILRFELDENHHLSNEEIDILESQMRTAAGPDYWATLTGNINDDFSSNLSNRLKAIHQSLPTAILNFVPTQHSAKVQQDAQIVRNSLNLTEDFLVWEIEVPAMQIQTSPIIRIIDTSDEGEGLSSQHISGRVIFAGLEFTVIYLKNNPSYVGCLKAYFAAQQKQKALANFIMEFAEGDI